MFSDEKQRIENRRTDVKGVIRRRALNSVDSFDRFERTLIGTSRINMEN